MSLLSNFLLSQLPPTFENIPVYSPESSRVTGTQWVYSNYWLTELAFLLYHDTFFKAEDMNEQELARVRPEL